MSRFNTTTTLDAIFADLRQRLATLETNPSIPWHEVGDTGEPAFTNSWVNFGVSDVPARFYKDGNGHVHVGGIVKNGVAAAIFTLPVGYRPSGTVRFICNANGALSTVDVTAAGVVTQTSGSTTWVDLSPVTFRAEA